MLNDLEVCMGRVRVKPGRPKKNLNLKSLIFFNGLNPIIFRVNIGSSRILDFFVNKLKMMTRKNPKPLIFLDQNQSDFFFLRSGLFEFSVSVFFTSLLTGIGICISNSYFFVWMSTFFFYFFL